MMIVLIKIHENCFFPKSNSKGGVVMVTLLDKNAKKKASPHKTDEFEKYLKEQRLRTTFNGIEIAAFSCYKRLPRLGQVF